MSTSEKAEKNHEKLFPNHQSTLKASVTPVEIKEIVYQAVPSGSALFQSGVGQSRGMTGSSEMVRAVCAYLNRQGCVPVRVWTGREWFVRMVRRLKGSRGSCRMHLR